MRQFGGVSEILTYDGETYANDIRYIYTNLLFCEHDNSLEFGVNGDLTKLAVFFGSLSLTEMFCMDKKGDTIFLRCIFFQRSCIYSELNLKSTMADNVKNMLHIYLKNRLT